MKKGMILLLCLLVGCSAQTEEMPAEEKLEMSEIFHKEGQLQDMYYTNLLENRLANVLKEEWQSLHIVMDKEDDSAAYDFIIDESDKINEIKQILSNTILTEEKEIEADNRMAIEISFSDKEPIILKCTDEGLFYTEKEYLVFQEPLSLYEKLSSYQENAQEVIALNFNETTSNFQSWADTIESTEPNEEIPETDNENRINIFPSEADDEWQKVLRLIFYIEEDFSDYHEITQWRELTAGLAVLCREKGYEVYAGTIGPYHDKSEIAFQDVGGIHPIASTLVNEYLTECKGKEILGEDFVFPEMESGVLKDGILFGANYNQDQKLIEIIEPYEVMFPQAESARILHLIEHDNVREYDVLFYMPSYEMSDTGADFTVRYMNENGDVFDHIEGNEDQFRQAHVVLQETETGIQFVSFETIHAIVPEEVEEEIDNEEPEPIIDEENEVQEEQEGSEVA